jgi:multidrug resistance protein, MATE family
MSDNQIFTKYKQGSVKQLWNLSFPLMISAFASLFMIFVDRCFLASYSINALNASVNAGTLAWGFLGGAGMLTAMSEIFVAQYNGAKLYNKVSIPVWQMIWVSLAFFVVYIPIGLYIAPYIFSGSIYSPLEIEYFSYLMIFGSAYATKTAIEGFYIGRGKTKFLIYLAILGNVVNIIMDKILIFGIPDIVPSMGIKGAAIATCLGNFIQAVILLFMFLSHKNRTLYNTSCISLNLETLKKCIKVGLPQSIFFSLEFVGWSVFYFMMTSISELHITISSICQSIIILLFFFCDGISRGIAALAGNFIGSKQYHLVYTIFKASLKLLSIFSIVLMFFLIVQPLLIINYLLPKQALSSSLMIDSAFIDTIKTCLFFVFIYLLGESIRWIFSGLLTAAGDTLFLLIAGACSVWIFLLLPIYFVVVKHSLSIEIAWLICCLYAVLISLLYGIRFFQGKWKNLNILPQDQLQESAETLE